VAWDPNNPSATSNYSTATTIYDSQGNAHTLTTYFRKTGTNDWEWHANIQGGAPAWVDGTLSFNNAGILTSQTPGSTTAQNITFPGVTTPQPINFDFSTNVTTQYASASTVTSKSQDGYAQGSLSKTTIDTEGYVIGVYSNGQSQKLAQIALAKFASTNGLIKAGSTVFQETLASGQALLSDASTPGTGTIQTNSLELSNVDMATEFVKLIQSQRAYSANSKTITTADQMTQEVLALIR
jgi:flagellar hook protein FlgE